MGDRGATATRDCLRQTWHRIVADGRSGSNRNWGCAVSGVCIYCSRWEIGEQPQHLPIVGVLILHCSRWEIGEQPQLSAAMAEITKIVADGRSGSNRNSSSSAMAGRMNCSRWEIGEQPQHHLVLTIKLAFHRLGELLHCRVGSKRVAYWHYSYSPPPNRACNFHRTRLSSVSFHLSFFPDDVKYRFDLLHYACLSVYRV